MYCSGSLETFENRLHQLAQSGQDFNSFVGEALSIQHFVSEEIIIKWNREFLRKYHDISGYPTGVLADPVYYYTDENGLAYLNESGFRITSI
jgi:hypothetical protein